MEALDKDVLGYALDKLHDHPDINFVVVADHGMINVDAERIYFISDYVPNYMLGEPTLCSSYCTIKPAKGYSAATILQKFQPLFETGGFRGFKYLSNFVYSTLFPI